MMTIELALAAALAFVPWPEVADWRRLPSEPICKAHYELAEKYLIELQERADVLGGWGREQLQSAIDETRAAKAFWWAAWYVSWPTASIEQRREWVDVARNLIGEPAYWSGSFPNPIPLWTLPYY